MSKRLSFDRARDCVKQLEELVSRKECWSCDCLQGLLTQLELDCCEIAAVVKSLKVPTEEMHGCLGCDPCPPGEAFARYIRRQNESADEHEGVTHE